MDDPTFEIRVEIDAEHGSLIEEILAGRETMEWMLQEELPSGRTFLTGYFPSRDAAEAGWASLQAALGSDFIKGGPILREMIAADWRDSYKAHFKSWQLRRLHWVPIWERESYVVPAGDEVVWLDPGMAFGTGNHETTRLCCERLVAWIEERRAVDADPTELSVIDVGCGSGILAISAAKLGIGAVAAFDIDEDAVRIARTNAALNQTEHGIEFFVADVRSGLRNRRADLVLANIQADVLVQHSADLITAIAPGGCLVLSGILADESEDVKCKFAGAGGVTVIEQNIMGEWSDLLVRVGA